MQAQRQVTCNHTIGSCHVARVPGLRVRADASARVRGEAKRVHRWLSDVRHWSSFYPGSQCCSSLQGPVRGPSCIPCISATRNVAQHTAGSCRQPALQLGIFGHSSSSNAFVGPHHGLWGGQLTGPGGLLKYSSLAGWFVLCRGQVCSEARQCSGAHPCGHKV